MIPVTKPFLPDKSEYQRYVDVIWDNQWVTNNGPLVKEFESLLGKKLQMTAPQLVSNGTIALQMAIKVLEINGDIITTPFSYVATTSSIKWEGCEPVFADIDQKTLNINPELIEGLINERTAGILATHCFGNACDIDRIDAIGKKYGIPVIYDAAHCFGTLYKGKSIFNYGDLSVCSLHATKLMHSIEGGLMFSNNNELKEKIASYRNFGHEGYENFRGLGTNGKNSEFHAAMGLCVLEHFSSILAKRISQCEIYDGLLEGLSIARPSVDENCLSNRAYYPIIFETQEKCLKAKSSLEKQGVFGRRYFYPSLSSLPYVKKQNTPVADDIASCILCLPLYDTLEYDEQKMICDVLLNTE
ncbi:MAG: dTDP-4-amino-4,6-dideoxygalactose transaminase [Roseivirga sp.]